MVASLLVLLVAVAIFWSSISNTAKNRLVQSMEITILPEGKAIFLNKTIIADSIESFIGNPIGKNAAAVNIRKLEGQLNKIPAVKKAEVYLGLDGALKLKVEERTPILFVQNTKGQQFYLDSHAVVIPNTPSTPFCDVLVANGNIPVIMEGGKIASGEIIRNVMLVAKFIAVDSVWNAQFQQLYVDNYNDVILIPRIGRHSIVVGNGVVEQHRVLGHDANRLSQTGLGQLPCVMSLDAYGTLLHIVETVEQPCQGGLARPRWTHHRHRLACRYDQTETMQDRPLRLVSEMHIFKAHLGWVVQAQVDCIGAVGHFLVLTQQLKHAVKVGQALFDFSVNHTQKIERDVKLDHECVDHHQITEAHLPTNHAFGGTPKHEHQRHRDDELLPDVEGAERILRLDPSTAQLEQTLVIARRLECFVAKVLYGFVIQQ